MNNVNAEELDVHPFDRYRRRRWDAIGTPLVGLAGPEGEVPQTAIKVSTLAAKRRARSMRSGGFKYSTPQYRALVMAKRRAAARRAAAARGKARSIARAGSKVRGVGVRRVGGVVRKNVRVRPMYASGTRGVYGFMGEGNYDTPDGLGRFRLKKAFKGITKAIGSVAKVAAPLALNVLAPVGGGLVANALNTAAAVASPSPAFDPTSDAAQNWLQRTLNRNKNTIASIFNANGEAAAPASAPVLGPPIPGPASAPIVVASDTSSPAASSAGGGGGFSMNKALPFILIGGALLLVASRK
jgi:hypothetical protein